MDSIIKPAEQITSCGDVSCEFLVDPIPRPRPTPLHVTIRPEKQQVVWIDSQKPNSNAVIQRANEILRAQGVDVKEQIIRKRSAGIAVSERLLDRLADEGGLVLSGIND